MIAGWQKPANGRGLGALNWTPMSDPGHAAGGAHLANTSKVIDACTARPPISPRGVRDWITVLGRPERQVVLAIRRVPDGTGDDQGPPRGLCR